MQKYGKARRTLHKINTAIETWMAKESKTHTKERIKQMEALKSSVHNEFVKIDNFVTNNQDRYETNEDKDIETFDKKHGSKYNAPVRLQLIVSEYMKKMLIKLRVGVIQKRIKA